MVSVLISVVVCGVFMIGVIPACDFLERVSPGNPVNFMLCLFWPIFVFPATCLWLGHRLSQRFFRR